MILLNLRQSSVHLRMLVWGERLRRFMTAMACYSSHSWHAAAFIYNHVAGKKFTGANVRILADVSELSQKT